MYKLKIFISSSVDGDGDNIFSELRKKIKRDLEEIKLFNVYIYEKGYGTSKNVVDDYLDEIYDSHLCLFLINSAESIPDGVKKEIDHAEKYRRSEEHTSELQSRGHLVCRLLLEKKKTHTM